jgi:uncharacterized protein GlcG (DUF336 family)
MSPEHKAAIAEQLVQEIIALQPTILTDAVEHNHSGGGNAACLLIDPVGGVHGRIFGDDKTRGRNCLAIATKKALQVWATGVATGRFEELVYSKQLSEGSFGLSRPELIGWLGGVPLTFADGSLLAAAFSGYRGETDVDVIVRAATRVAGLTVKVD